MDNSTVLKVLFLATMLCVVIVHASPLSFSSSPIELYMTPQPIFVEEEGFFSICICIRNVQPPGIFAYEMVLYYDVGCLEATRAEIPQDHFLAPSSPEGVFIVDGGTVDNDNGRVSFVAVLLAPEESKTGSGVIACVEFKAVAPGNCSLTIGDVILVDPEPEAIPPSQYKLEDGKVTVVAGVPPPPLSPFEVYVSPQHGSLRVGQRLSICVYIAKAPLPGVFAYNFSVLCNRTVLEAVVAGVPRGHFLDTSLPETWHIIDNGTINNELGVVSFAVTRLALEEGKTGNGVLGCVEFVAVSSGNSPITIADMTLLDQNGTVFPSSQYELLHGSVDVSPTPPPPTPSTVYVSPLYSSMAVDDPLYINISIANVSSPGLFAYELTLRYDSSILKAVSAEIPEGHFLTPSSPENVFIVHNGIIDHALGEVSFAVTLLAAEEAKTGMGVLATIQFKAIAAGDVAFQLEDVILTGPEVGPFQCYGTIESSVHVVPEFEYITVFLTLLLYSTFLIIIAKKRRRITSHQRQ